MTRLKSLTKKQLRALIAILVAVCVVVPSLVFVGLNVRAENPDQVQKRQVEQVVTKKTVSETADPNVFDVQLEAYMTSKAIDYKPTDIILVLDLSGSMGDPLTERGYENLNNHTVFGKSIPFVSGTNFFGNTTYNVSYHTLYDPGNNANKEDLSLVGTLTSTYRNRKYIEDPNTPGIYVYVSEAYLGIYDLKQHYQFDFTDSMGNVYSTGDLPGFFADGVDSLTFNLVRRGPDVDESDDIKTTHNINCFYTRDSSDTSSINQTMINYVSGLGDFVQQNQYSSKGIIRDGLTNYTSKIVETVSAADYASTDLFIFSDSGEKLPVTISVEQTRRVETYEKNNKTITEYDKTFISNYIYRAEDPQTGKTYIAVQGNSVYGADYGVFQGFKTYKWKTDDNGNPVYKLDSNGNPTTEHELEVVHSESIESKSLYHYTDDEITVSRLQTMKEAVEQFIIDVHSNAYYRDIDQRIGIVTYNGSATPEVQLTDVRNEINTNAIIDSVYGFEASGATRIDLGMLEASEMLESRTDQDRNSVVIAFTDGVPSTYSDYNIDVADDAIEYSLAMTNLYDTKTYSVGLFELADSNQMYGSMYYHSGIFNQNEPCTGEVGSKWGRTNIAGWGNSDMSDVDAAATNRFLNLLSSNYPTADKVGIEKVSGLFSGSGYEITQNYPKEGSDYYYGANSSEDLYNAFKKIAEDVAVPENTLGTETTLLDVISDSFEYVEGSAQAYTLSYVGTTNSETDMENDANWTTPSDNLNSFVTVDEKTVSLSGDETNGFDYSANYVNALENNDAGNHGKKAVLTFQIKTIDNFVGGNQVLTNGEDSGIYGSDNILVEDFELPTKNIPIAYSLETEDQEVFLTQHAELMELLNLPKDDNGDTLLDGVTNGYANILYTVTDSETNEVVFTYYIPAGTKGDGGLLSLSEDEVVALKPVLSDNKTYQVSCVVTPTFSGDIPVTTKTDDGTVYVYKPVITVKDDSETFQNATTQGVDLSYESLVWKATGKEDGITSGAPSVTYKVKNTTDDNVPAEPTNAYIIDATKDYQVYDVTITGNTYTYTADYECYIRKNASGDDKYVQISDYTETPSEDEFEVVTDEDGNTVYMVDDQGNTTTTPVFKTATRTITKNVTVADRNNDDATYGGFTTFINSSDADKESAERRTNGEFTITIGKVFEMVISKVFAGSYVNPEDVTIVVKPVGGDTASEQTVEFADTDFSYSNSQFTAASKTISGLEANRSYLIFERYNADSSNAEAYTTEFDVTSGQTSIVDDDTTDGYQFTLVKPNDENQITVVVTNTMPNPVITGISDKDSKLNPFFIAAAVIALLGGTGTAYVVKRKSETEA